MKLNDLSTTSKKFSRQVAAYEAAGMSPDMEIHLPFAVNLDHFFNTEALIAAGIDPMGLARQLDQVLIENIGNNLASKVKAALAKGVPLPDQEVIDEMVAAYDFTGIRSTSEEGMSTEERTIISEIKKALRRLISDGTFANLGPDGAKTREPSKVVFNATRIQTGPEAKGDRPTPPNSVPLENFDNLVAAAYEGVEVEFEDGNGNTATLDFSIEPAINDHGQAVNLTGVIELARQEAARVLERNRTKAVPTVAIQIG
jgi:hypothetical protein